jgi:hypothetical protein
MLGLALSWNTKVVEEEEEEEEVDKPASKRHSKLPVRWRQSQDDDEEEEGEEEELQLRFSNNTPPPINVSLAEINVSLSRSYSTVRQTIYNSSNKQYITPPCVTSPVGLVTCGHSVRIPINIISNNVYRQVPNGPPWGNYFIRYLKNS